MRISTNNISFMAGTVFLLGLSAGGVSCSSSSSSSDYVAICEQSCNKGAMCAGLSNSASLCMSQCMSQANASNCPNASQVAAAIQKCNGMSDCTQFTACLDAAPECQGGSATGGTSGTHTGGTNGTGTGGTSSTGTGGAGGRAGTGTGGTTGAAGNGGTADCSSCDKANTCCMALATMLGQPTSSCTLSKANCTASGGSSATYAMSCDQVLQTGKGFGISSCQ